MEIIDSKTVKIYTSLELKEILENDNTYEYIYIANNITLQEPITINQNKTKITINGTYDNIKYKLTGMNSNESTDTIIINSNNKEINFKNIQIEYTNTYGLIYVQENKTNKNVILIYDNVNFTGTKLALNTYGTTKIIDSTIKMEETNTIIPQEVCKSHNIIIGGTTNITSTNASGPVFSFRSDTIGPSLIFLCRSNVTITSDNNALMNGTSRLNFTILHDTFVNIITCNGFAAYTIHGANNVLIEERASLLFIENNHKRIPMWSIFGNFTMKKDSSLEVINSYASTPSDNYNIHFKGQNQSLILEDPKSVKFYTKNANVIYTNNEISFQIKCSRFNLWNNAKALAEAGDINDLPDYFWYKEKSLLEISGKITSTTTNIEKHNLTEFELSNLSDISNFSFQNKKVFSIGNNLINVHPINNTLKKISGHSVSNSSVIIKYNDISEIIYSDTNGLFEYDYVDDILDDTKIEITTNDPNGFIYGTRIIKSPYEGELSLMDSTNVFEFNLVPIESYIFPKNKSLIIKVVDSRVNKTNWKILASIEKNFTSQLGYIVENALVFKKFNDEIITLSINPQIVYTKTGSDEVTIIEWSVEKGPLLDLTNKYLEVNEEYFTCINFKLEE